MVSYSSETKTEQIFVTSHTVDELQKEPDTGVHMGKVHLHKILMRSGFLGRKCLAMDTSGHLGMTEWSTL